MVFDVSNKDLPRIPGRGTSSKTWQKSKFEKQREEEVLRNAHERGYLRDPTVNDIFDSFGEKCDLEDISYLNMSRICLDTVQTIDLCTRLRICVLHSNYISSFDSLSFCRNLVYLDLHNNQVFLISFSMVYFISFCCIYYWLWLLTDLISFENQQCFSLAKKVENVSVYGDLLTETYSEVLVGCLIGIHLSSNVLSTNNRN